MRSESAGKLDLIRFLDGEETGKSVVITDPNLPDNPMVFVSDEFYTHTGFYPSEVIGHNCRFLQGQETNQDCVAAIRHAIKARTTFVIDLRNYRKDGTAFTNRLRIRPLFDKDGKLIYFAGAQNPV